MEITNRRITGTFTDTAEGLKYEGSFQQNTNEHLIQFNCSVADVSGENPVYIGDVYSFLRGGNVALNYNGFAASIIGKVAAHCEELVSELDSADSDEPAEEE